MKENLLISFSGGRTSAFMTWYLLKNYQHKYNMVVVFANTGKEREETLEFVNKCDIEFGFNTVWVEAFVHYEKGKATTHVITNFKDAERNGEPFEDVIIKYGIPTKNFPHCTRELKLQPIKSFAKSIGWDSYKLALGIRSDEPKRLNWNKAKENNILYFAELGNVTKSDVNAFWANQSFDLNLKSYEGNCDLCYKKSERKLMTIVTEHPEFAKWWRQMEVKYENHDPRGNNKIPYRFYRDNLTIDEIIEEARHPFEPARDESKDIDRYKQIRLWDEYLDSNSGCTESCEIF